MQIKLDSSIIEQLHTYSELLNKSSDQIIKEALQDYFLIFGLQITDYGLRKIRFVF